MGEDFLACMGLIFYKEMGRPRSCAEASNAKPLSVSVRVIFNVRLDILEFQRKIIVLVWPYSFRIPLSQIKAAACMQNCNDFFYGMLHSKDINIHKYTSTH
jgi:hypothetical protein